MRNTFILILAIHSAIYSQNVVSSNTYINFCYNKQECYSIGNSALIFLNNRNNEFLVQIDFNKFKIGNDTLDEWLNFLPESNLTFKGQLNLKNAFGLDHQTLKPIEISGIVNFNGVLKPITFDLIIWKPNSNYLQVTNNNENEFVMLNVSMHIRLRAKDFKIDSRNHHFTKMIDIVVSKGFVNELTPDLELIIKN